MPTMNGFEVVKRIEPLLASKPVVTLVMLTSSCSLADQGRAAELPVIRGFVTKPLTADLVRDLLAKALSQT
jgi:CheY-like chemotaxis protein